MRAFEIYLNDKKVCRAGIGPDGVLTTIVSSVTRKNRADISLSVAGLITPVNEHVKWVKQDVRVGDDIRIKIVETNSSDIPADRQKTNPAEDLRYQKSYVRAMAKKLGWKIQPNRRTS